MVAVSIPIFTSQLEKAREATDMSNLRAAKAEAVSEYLTGDLAEGISEYDIATGKLVASGSGSKGKGTANNPGTFDGTNEYGYNSSDDASSATIQISYTKGTGGGSDTLTVGFSNASGTKLNLADSSTTGTAPVNP